jgi:mannan endo-1,4-beta-mannosidase
MKQLKFVMAIITVLALALSCATGGGSAAPAVEVIPYTWNFTDAAAGTAGWELAEGEHWDYKGTLELTRDDSTFGAGKLRLDVDFTADSNSEWSEPKIKYAFSEPFDMTGIRRFTFDIYYNPQYATRGQFNSKVIVLVGNRTMADRAGNLINATEEVGDYVKATISLPFGRVNTPIDNIIFSIAGFRTNYKGPVFLDNMRLE